MGDRILFLIVAAVFISGGVVTLRRGWFRYPFLRVDRANHAPLYWFAVASSALGALLAVAAALSSN